MSKRLEGKTALVTGAGKRLGRAVALGLAGEGAKVVVHYNRSRAEAEAVVGELQRLGSNGWALGADLASPREAEGLVERAADLAGRLDVLVCSASIFPPCKIEDLSIEDLHGAIDVNAWAPFVLGRELARRAGGGSIVNFLDTTVAGYDWRHVGYHASKVLLELMTRVMALRFAPAVAVNAVAPGLILPPEGKDQAWLEGLKDTVPMKRVGGPRAIVEAVLFLATSEFTTGQVIFVDGGRHLLGGDAPPGAGVRERP